MNETQDNFKKQNKTHQRMHAAWILWIVLAYDTDNKTNTY